MDQNELLLTDAESFFSAYYCNMMVVEWFNFSVVNAVMMMK